jgi:hypothetical protein
MSPVELGTPWPCPGGCGHPLTVHSADLGCWLCDCTYGRQPTDEPVCAECGGPHSYHSDTESTPDWDEIRVEALQRASEQIAAFAQQQVVTEAELALGGIHPVSVVHGDPETEADANLMFTVLPALARRCGHVRGTRGGNDYTTYLFAGDGADGAAIAFTAAVLEIAPRWWRVTPTAHPVFHVDGDDLT